MIKSPSAALVGLSDYSPLHHSCPREHRVETQHVRGETVLMDAARPKCSAEGPHRRPNTSQGSIRRHCQASTRCVKKGGDIGRLWCAQSLFLSAHCTKDTSPLCTKLMLNVLTFPSLQLSIHCPGKNILRNTNTRSTSYQQQ